MKFPLVAFFASQTLNKENQAPFSFTIIFYATQMHEINQSTTDDMEFSDISSV